MKPKHLLIRVKCSPCETHKPANLGYLQWFEYAEAKTKKGEKQKQCTKCGRWYFKSEF